MPISRPISLLVWPASRPSRTSRSRTGISAMRPRARLASWSCSVAWEMSAGGGRRKGGQQLTRIIRDRQEVHRAGLHHLHRRLYIALELAQDDHRQANAPGLEPPRDGQTARLRTAHG